MSTQAEAGMAPYAVYLDYLRRGQLAYQFSEASGKAVFYPRLLCPDTGGPLQWRISQGAGTVYSTTAVQPRQGEPYNVALIDCDEGFRLMSRVEGLPAGQVAIGMRVRFAVHEPAGDADPYPVFFPLEQS
ncbi:Zn-ribbon domain-containing OB-fold protein [Bordetella petrii]|uniref:Zn-ribbon domain-containing OB-fold protein n=1 Tax=Bordetella petrii TaxID=94624 RepID=UPI001E6167F4|nr:OB-fold domain-containing protein [Bordetella petrii]MCD0501460.1 OB-fold domain-containing protein [Bordetella petrii]